MAEILDCLQEEDVGNIYIEPPQDGSDATDDEFGDDENVNIFSHKILMLPAELRASRKDVIKDNITKMRTRSCRLKKVVKPLKRAQRKASQLSDGSSIKSRDNNKENLPNENSDNSRREKVATC